MKKLKTANSDSKIFFNQGIINGLRSKNLHALLFLALINWISHYLYFIRFGLYEDDYANIPYHFQQNFNELYWFINTRLNIWVQGHPLSFLPGLITFLCKEISEGIFILYLVSFLIVTVNSFLMYKILAKIFPGSAIFSISGALAFCLFPPDTTKMLLCHSFVLQISLAFLLCASLLYLNDKKILSYFVILLTLFSYESTFMVFFAVPLLINKWNVSLRKEMLVHISILSLTIFFVFLYRSFAGEDRVMEASSDLYNVFSKMVAGMFIGPSMILFLFYRAPAVTVYYWLTENHQVFWWYYDYIFIIFGLCFGFFAILFYKMKSYKYYPKKTETENLYDNYIYRNEDNVRFLLIRSVKFIVVSLIMLNLAYSLSFTHYPPNAIMGRLTSEHLAATFGGSILFASICLILFTISEKFNFKKIAVLTLSIYLALVVGYDIYVQKEFVISWGYQKDFWKRVLELAPDLNDNTTIVVNCDNRNEDTRYIYSNSIYNDMIMFSNLFNFPGSWNSVPKLLIVKDNWKEDYIKVENGELKLDPPYLKKGTFAFADSNVVLLEYNNDGEMTRKFSSVEIQGLKLNLKPLTNPTIYNFPKKQLFKYLLGSK